MEFELLNELVENGYDGNDLDELFEFCIDYILEYESLIERSAQKRALNKVIELTRKNKPIQGDLHKTAQRGTRFFPIAMGRDAGEALAASKKGGFFSKRANKKLARNRIVVGKTMKQLSKQ